MVAWDDYRAHAKGRGALALQLFVVESTPTGNVPIPDVLPEHLAYQKELEEAGQLFMAGPVSDASGENMEGAGLVILRAGNMSEAAKIASEDPMHAKGARTYTLRKWLVNEGSLNLSVGLSTGRVQLD